MHPIFLFYISIIISFSIIILQMIVIVSCRHWGNHLHCYSCVNLLFQWGTVLLFQVGCKEFIFCHVFLLIFPHFSYVLHIQFSIISVLSILFCVTFSTTDILLFYSPPYLLFVYPLLGYALFHHSLLLSSFYYAAA